MRFIKIMLILSLVGCGSPIIHDDDQPQFFPVPETLHLSIGCDEIRAPAEAAIAMWNDVAGRALFSESSDGVPIECRPQYKYHSATEVDEEGCYRIITDPMRNPITLEHELTHEYGHCIGFRHSSNPDSIMCGRPYTCGYWDKFSDSIIEKLQEAK